ncbi:2-isopropylmalate synthase [Psychromonas antarctica]|uniref:2-isopropylmalate synthase n=1 Tax=Psychromonas antarctica TaxID=67573 RepID=UPI001EE8C043|nr:2-isopropylmalate synthase [Psychromonas antarctica]MCG6199983.1 2-isopropylmalate synthase [Psychromonas antarctica]
MVNNTDTQPAFNHKKYRAYPAMQKKDRRWPDQVITAAPKWCSVDLRDGNQALIEPMSPSQKLDMFKLLIDVGFKEIEVGFPAASAPDFDFVRLLIEQDLIPDDVTIQILTQAREHLIARSFSALEGAKKAIVHLYNSTSTVQREHVFKKSREEIKTMAQQGAQWIQDYAAKQCNTHWSFQYSPESFTSTEMDYAVEVCDAVINIWQPTPDNKVIINLPATIEVSTPNIYADQIEWVNDNISHREAVTISLHTHNDRGCGVAAAELGVLAGADRIEGTLLGNGERTGNMDIVTMAMNLYSQGIDPKLKLADMDRIIATIERCTQLPVHPRHPYAGELVFAAFSGSHQDAINKCMDIDTKKRQADPLTPWQVAYLPIDPRDLGRSYQQVIRINSQSGKGGVAYILEQDYGIKMPRWMQIDFSPHVQSYAEKSAQEVCAATIYDIFSMTYLAPHKSAQVHSYQLNRQGDNEQLRVTIISDHSSVAIEGQGKGVLDAFISGLSRSIESDIVVIDYSEHALPSRQGAENEQAEALAYVQLSINGMRYCAAAKCNDIVSASLQAVLNAVVRSGINISKRSKVNVSC